VLLSLVDCRKIIWNRFCSNRTCNISIRISRSLVVAFHTWHSADGMIPRMGSNIIECCRTSSGNFNCGSSIPMLRGFTNHYGIVGNIFRGNCACDISRAAPPTATGPPEIYLAVIAIAVAASECCAASSIAVGLSE